jgi:hypothetical protein
MAMEESFAPRVTFQAGYIGLTLADLEDTMIWTRPQLLQHVAQHRAGTQVTLSDGMANYTVVTTAFRDEILTLRNRFMALPVTYQPHDRTDLLDIRDWLDDLLHDHTLRFVHELYAAHAQFVWRADQPNPFDYAIGIEMPASLRAEAGVLRLVNQAIARDGGVFYPAQSGVFIFYDHPLLWFNR